MSTFPQNVVEAILTHIPQYFENPGNPTDPATNYTFVDRPVLPTDPARTMSCFSVGWAEEPNSELIGQVEPGMGRYLIRMETLVKNFPTFTEGWQIMATDAKLLRVVMYRDPGLQAELRTFSETIVGVVERFKDLKVTGQQTNPATQAGMNMLVTVTNIIVKTETTG